MGQRHQFFAIARINNRYRTLAVVHHQWLYGHRAVRQCLNTMRILAATGNLQEIRRELKLAESKPDGFWEAKPRARGDDQNRGIDFPFTTMCLALGCGITPGEHGQSRVHELDIDAKYDGVQNDDGVSVFDVTVPGEPKYAMIQLTKYEDYEDEEDENGDPVEIDTTSDAFEPNTILNASDYLLRYWQETHVDADMTRARMLDDLPQLDVAALTSAWPHGDFRARKNANGSGRSEKEDSPTNPVKTLTAASMRAVIERTIQDDPSNVDLLAEAERVPGFTKALRAHLHDNPDRVQGRSFSVLLGHIYGKCPLADLSPFWRLSFDDVLAVVEDVASSGDVFSLALPDLEALTATGLRRLLSNGLVHELRLGEHNIGDLGQFLNVIDGTSITSFNAPELYPRSFAPLDLGRARTQEEVEQFDMIRPWTSPVPSLPRPKQFPVAQLVFVQWPTKKTPPTKERGDWVPPWSELLTTGTQSRKAILLSLPMSDYFLSAAQWIKALPRFISHLALPNAHGYDLLIGSTVLGLVRRLALKDDLTVEATPGELTAFAKRMAGMSPSPFAPTLPLKQDEYTIVIFYEHSWKDDPEHPLRLRYGFATLDAEGKTQVLSASDFAHAHMPAAQKAAALVSEWERETGRVCGELERGHRREARRLVRSGGVGWNYRTDEEIERMVSGLGDLGLRLEVSCPAEVDELFGALGKSGRLVAGE